MTSLDEFSMTPEEAKLFDEWNTFRRASEKVRPQVSEMVEMCETMARHYGADARAIRKAYDQPFSPDAARKIVVLEAIARLLARLQANAGKWPKELKMVIGG
jgi:hypothetical protein